MKKIYISFLAFFLAGVVSAQVMVSENGGNPDPSAGLDVDFSNKGFLPPRLSTSEREAILSPADGLVIFNTTTNCLNFRVAGFWKEVCGECTPAVPPANAGPDQLGVQSTQVTLSANPPTFGLTGSWQIISGNGGSLGNSADPNTLFNGTLGQTYVLNWTISGTCGSSQDQVTIEMILPEKRVFITSTSHSGAMGGLAGADNICQNRANAASLGGTWKAWLSGGSSTSQFVANRFTQANAAYRRLDNTIIANNWAQLTSGTLLAPININEFGGISGASQVWTNTLADGTAVNSTAGFACSDWTSTSGFSAIGKPGEFGLSGGRWTWGSPGGCLGGYGFCYQNCTGSYPLYCVEQ